MARPYNLTINEYGILTSYPSLKSQATPAGRYHVADQFAIIGENGARRYLSKNTARSRMQGGQKVWFMAPGEFEADPVKTGDVIEISGKKNLLADETVDPDPVYGVVLERTASSLRVQPVDTLEAAQEARQEVLAGRTPVVAEEISADDFGL